MAETKLPADIFDVPVKNHALIKLAYDAYLANSRMDNAKTLKRGEVRGGGKKPWRQKGTGRARFGSIRNPIWRGGGIAFGPNGEQNHKIKLSKQDKRVAVAQALSLANREGRIVVADWKLTGKTKDAIQALEHHKIADKARILGVAAAKTPEIIRSTNNIPNLKVVSALYLNVYDILNADAIVIGTAALEKITDWLGTEAK